ncbi:MAG: LPS export ABC transporter periplasmic protein LptC [Desulfobacteraceae bacterium]|jgi:LPS export ABC transporter protein LptC|nr:LPS export ABC transporter periplasmic protein LptC [Desulfobacteraceae bacterium]
MKRRRLIQRVLLSIVVLVLAGTIVVFIGYRRMTRNPEALVDLVKNEADMQLNRIRQTAMKNGIREWRLEADSATLLEKNKTMQLANPDVEFFMDDGDHVHLTAEQGTIYTDSSRMKVSGRVSANTSLYRFQTDALDYDPAARELHTDTPVTLSGESFTLQADMMTMNLETSITRFEGGVEGTISEDLQL